ncbi:unnamed protein product [Amoebophrya sp. A25]|nr:unnamed protein product [Amoebophrya sp. A25]|eukprot:GSA25T00006977001.1
MPFVTESLVPSASVVDSRVPRFHSVHVCELDFADYGTRLMYALRKGMSEDEILEMLRPSSDLRAGPLSSNSYSGRYERQMHVQDQYGRTLLHYACRYNFKNLVAKILDLNRRYYLDPLSLGPRGRFKVDARTSRDWPRHPEHEQLERLEAQRQWQDLVNQMKMNKNMHMGMLSPVKGSPGSVVLLDPARWKGVAKQPQALEEDKELEDAAFELNGERGLVAPGDAQQGQNESLTRAKNARHSYVVDGAAEVKELSRSEPEFAQNNGSKSILENPKTSGQQPQDHVVDHQGHPSPADHGEEGDAVSSSAAAPTTTGDALDGSNEQNEAGTSAVPPGSSSTTSNTGGDPLSTTGTTTVRQGTCEGDELLGTIGSTNSKDESSLGNSKEDALGGSIGGTSAVADKDKPAKKASSPNKKEKAGGKKASPAAKKGKKKTGTEKTSTGGKSSSGKHEIPTNATPGEIAELHEKWRKETEDELAAFRKTLKGVEDMWSRRKINNDKLKEELAVPRVPTVEELVAEGDAVEWPGGTRIHEDTIREHFKSPRRGGSGATTEKSPTGDHGSGGKMQTIEEENNQAFLAGAQEEVEEEQHPLLVDDAALVDQQNFQRATRIEQQLRERAVAQEEEYLRMQEEREKQLQQVAGASGGDFMSETSSQTPISSKMSSPTAHQQQQLSGSLPPLPHPPEPQPIPTFGQILGSMPTGVDHFTGCALDDIKSSPKTKADSSITDAELRRNINLLEIEDKFQQTPIIEATKLGRKQIFDMLVSAGAHINYDDGAEHITEQLFELSTLREQFYHNSIGSRPGNRRLGDMQAGIDDWIVDQKYSQVFHKLEREIGVLYGRGGLSSNQEISAHDPSGPTDVMSRRMASLRDTDGELDPEAMILKAPDIVESMRLQKIKDKEREAEEEAKRQAKERKEEALRERRRQERQKMEDEMREQEEEERRERAAILKAEQDRKKAEQEAAKKKAAAAKRGGKKKK